MKNCQNPLDLINIVCKKKIFFKIIKIQKSYLFRIKAKMLPKFWFPVSRKSREISLNKKKKCAKIWRIYENENFRSHPRHAGNWNLTSVSSGIKLLLRISDLRGSASQGTNPDPTLKTHFYFWQLNKIKCVSNVCAGTRIRSRISDMTRIRNTATTTSRHQRKGDLNGSVQTVGTCMHIKQNIIKLCMLKQK